MLVGRTSEAFIFNYNPIGILYNSLCYVRIATSYLAYQGSDIHPQDQLPDSAYYSEMHGICATVWPHMGLPTLGASLDR